MEVKWKSSKHHDSLMMKSEPQQDRELCELIRELQSQIGAGDLSNILDTLSTISQVSMNTQNLFDLELTFERESMASTFIYCVFMRNDQIRQTALDAIAMLCRDRTIAQCFIEKGFITVISESLQQHMDFHLAAHLVIILEELMRISMPHDIPFAMLRTLCTKDVSSSYIFAKIMLNALVLDNSFDHIFVYDTITLFRTLDLCEGFHFFCWCLVYIIQSPSFVLNDFVSHDMDKFLLLCLSECQRFHHVKRPVFEACASLARLGYALEIPPDIVWQFCIEVSRPDLARTALLAFRWMLGVDVTFVEFFSDSSKWQVLLDEHPFNIQSQIGLLFSDYICLVRDGERLGAVVEMGVLDLFARLISDTDDSNLKDAIVSAVLHLQHEFFVLGMSIGAGPSQIMSEIIDENELVK